MVGAESRWEAAKEQMQGVETSSTEYLRERVKILVRKRLTCTFIAARRQPLERRDSRQGGLSERSLRREVGVALRRYLGRRLASG